MMLIGRLRPDRQSHLRLNKSGRPRADEKYREPISRRKEAGQLTLGAATSFLEQLPTELLQDIFLYSANVHLPLCSKILNAALSSDHLKFEFALQVLIYQADRLERHDRSLLLSRRFFTWEFVVRYTRFAHTRVPDPKDSDDEDEETESDTESDSDGEEDATSVTSAAITGTSTSASSRAVSRATSVTSRTSVGAPDLEEVDARLTELTKEGIQLLWKEDFDPPVDENHNATTVYDELAKTKGLAGLHKLEMPNKLLHGKWDDDHIRLLRMLTLFDCTAMAADKSTFGIQGAFEAIDSQDEEAMVLLLGANMGIVPTTDMLRRAMTLGNIDIIFCMLHADQGQIEMLDPEVWNLLENHLRWEKKVKRRLRDWLKRDVTGPVSNKNRDYMPRAREIDVEEERWWK